jgi:hypothetical protein
MVFSNIMQRFKDRRPVAVMTQMILQKQFSDAFFNSVFKEVAKEQYVRTLTLSTCAQLMAEVTFGRAKSIHAAYGKDQKNVAASIGSLYEKLQRIEPAVCEELVSRSAVDLGELVASLRKRPEPVPGYRLRFLDGNVLAGSEHRLRELRGLAAAAMPGLSLVFYDHDTDLISDLVACEDGQASERRLLPRVYPKIKQNDLITADRNFCTEDMLVQTTARGAAFLIRHHKQMVLLRQGKAKDCGRCSTGRVFEQEVILLKNSRFRCRAITIVRDKPLEDGGRKVMMLTNLPADKASASQLAELYLKRWTIEEAFRQLTQYLSCEVRTLGYPKAALFAFTLAVLGYNTVSCIHAALLTAKADAEVSNYYIAWEIKTTFEGMLIAIPPEEWSVFATMDNVTLAEILREIAQTADLDRYAKHKRTAKKTTPRKKVKSKHVSTSEILETRKKKPVETVSRP